MNCPRQGHAADLRGNSHHTIILCQSHKRQTCEPPPKTPYTLSSFSLSRCSPEHGRYCCRSVGLSMR
ncbi:hypothetical protein BJX68DRAFT_240882 [Aspergillus pseudodeflectus]|uniref:Uncharacterized protein n=1 Tax=Aspergillus pseudodeflectus TaxID=176178 RepID=A0ABR4K5X8_9EURO